VSNGRIRVGTIGAGWVGTARHLPSFKRHAAVDVVSVFDRTPARAQKAAADHQIPHVSRSLDEFFDQGLDIVDICTPPWQHAELTLEAVRRGAHVFCEKPMAMNEGEATAMVDAARSANRLLCISHNFLYSRAVRKANQLLGSPPRVDYALGLQCSSDRRRLPTWYERLPGGLFMDESPHLLYTLQHFLGGELRLEGCRASKRADSGLPSSMELQLRGATGLGQITMLFDAPVSEWHIGLVNRERVVDLDLFRDIVMHAGSDGAHGAMDILRTSARAVAGHTAGFASSGARLVARRQYWGHELIIERFVDAVRGKGAVPVAPERSVEIVRITDQVIEQLGLAPAATAAG
jgi:predicted dehydrogenase